MIYKTKWFYWSMEWSRKGTPWNWRIDRVRYDHIFSLQRAYDRISRCYAWCLIIGCFQLVIAKRINNANL